MASLAEKRVSDSEDGPADPQARPEELRLLEALLFASTEPLDQATLAKRMPEGGLCLARCQFSSRRQQMDLPHRR